MTEGGFYQQKRMNPQAVAIVVLLHGAALTALMMAKGDVVGRHIFPPIDVFNVPVPPPPPPRPIPPQPKTQQPQDPQVTTVQPIVHPPIQQPFTLPPVPPPPIGQVSQIEPPPLPTPPPPPPPPARKFEPARARANLGSYVSDADYPDSAIRAEEQGTTRFRLEVAADGHVTNCIVTGSSGSSALDAATCRLMKSRARFAPARDSSGNPTTDTVANAIHWVLPAG